MTNTNLIGATVEFYPADVPGAPDDAPIWRSQGAVVRIAEDGQLVLATPSDEIVTIPAGACQVIAEPTERITPPTLSELVVALSMGGREIADELGVTIRTVEAWVYGVRQPSATNRAALLKLIERVYDRVQRQASAARLQAFSNCRIALNLRTPAQRAAWIANRAELRAQFAGAASAR